MTAMWRNHPVDKPVDAIDPGRIIAFSDGVVAIAITLLILPLTTIELPKSADTTNPLGYVWQENGSLILSFLITWLVIITFWMKHNRVFRNFENINQSVVSWNIVWLFAVIVLPFPMNLLNQVENSDAILNADRQVVSFYIGTMAVISIALSMISRQTNQHPELMTEAARNSERSTSPIVGWMFSIYLVFLTFSALIAPNIALWGLTGLYIIPKIAKAISERHTGDRTPHRRQGASEVVEVSDQ
jgi:uncharacterized membrane protein